MIFCVSILIKSNFRLSVIELLTINIILFYQNYSTWNRQLLLNTIFFQKLFSINILNISKLIHRISTIMLFYEISYFLLFSFIFK